MTLYDRTINYYIMDNIMKYNIVVWFAWQV